MVKLIISFFFCFCLSAITVDAKVRKIMYYDIKDSLFLGYLQKSIEKNAVGIEDTIYAKVTYVTCYISCSKYPVDVMVTYEYFRHIIGGKDIYGVTIINGIPMFLCKKKCKMLFKKRGTRLPCDIRSVDEFRGWLIEGKNEKVVILPDKLKIYRIF